jgi:Kef-type K+ transport system membrane component KefB
MNLLMLLVFAGLTHATRSFMADGEPGSSGTSLAFGYLLVSGYFAGRVVAQIGLPKLTGYLLLGGTVGPPGLGLISQSMVESLSLVNGMAVAMIALTAGTELELSKVKAVWRTVAAITAFAVIGTIFWLGATIWLARPMLPFFENLSGTQSAWITVVLAIVLVAQSPAIVVALHDELRADGPITRSVLAVVVLADLVVIFLFALASAATRATMGESADVLHTIALVGWEIGGSIVVGFIVGALLVLYLRHVKADAALMLLFTTFVVAEIGSRLGLDPLLVALAAGAFVRNGSRVADELHHHLQMSSLPVYVLFFCVAGANLQTDALAIVWLPATLIATVRAIGLFFGSRVGTRLAGAEVNVQRFAGYGLLPQAGLAQALALLFSRTFPEVGPEPSTLILAVVTLNVLVSPVVYRLALARSGEANRQRDADVEASGEPPALPSPSPSPPHA